MPYDWRDYVANDPSDFKPKEKKKKKGGPSRPPSSRRASTWDPTDDALVWAQEQQIQSFQLPQVPKKKKVPKTFAEAIGQRPLSWQEREALRRKRVQWAKEAFDPRKRDTAQQKLAATMTPDRQLDLLKRDMGQPGERVEADSFNKMVARTRIKKRIRETKDEDERKRLTAALDFMEDEGFNPLHLAGRGIGEGLGLAEQGVSLLGKALLSAEDRRTLAAYFDEVQKDVEGYSRAATKAVLPAKLERAQQQKAGVGSFPERMRRIAASSIATGIQSIIGLGPGVVYMAREPQQAYDEYLRYIKSYYGGLAQGDTTALEEQGITPALMDILAVASAGLGGAARTGAIGRTARFPGELRISSEGRAISRPEAYLRAAVLRQEPVPILGTETTTMGRVVPHRAVGREQPLREGDTIQEGDRVEYRVGDEVKETRASEDNGLAGLDAPDANNPIVRQVHGEDAEVMSAYRTAEFEQRMVPRSPVGEFISDLYNWARPDTRRERGILSGKGRRTKLRREAVEVQEDRFRGQIKAFMKDHKDIQKDVVLSTAYDRMLRYRDPARQIPEEIAARRQRGRNQTREQRQVIGALEKAQAEVTNPSPKLQAAVEAGRMLSADTEAFLLNTGRLTPERALVAKLAAERWLKPGALEDEPLSSPIRVEIENELREHFWGNEEATRVGMAYTDTLARAWGERTGRNPADWYEENIRSVETVAPEHIEALSEAEQGLLHQDREYKRWPRPQETFPLRDPETGDMRVARFIEQDHNDPELALVEWVREPDAGKRFTIPAEAAKGNTSKIHGWYSGIANEVEKLPERVSKQEATSRLKKAPGIKADEWKWLGMDGLLENLFPPGTKSVHRDNLRESIRTYALRFETVKLSRDEAFYETHYDVTLPGPRWDYDETLLYYPHRYVDEPVEYDWHDLVEMWYEDHQEQLRMAEEAGDTELAEYLQGQIDHAVQYGPDNEDLNNYLPEKEEPLYSAPHFESRPGYGGYGDEADDYSGNLMAHLRRSGRWQGGRPIRVIEEAQSDWHAAGRRTGYRTPENERIMREKEERASYTRELSNDARKTYLSAFVKKLAEQDIHVRSRISGEEGNVLRDSYGETPEFRIVIEEAKTETPREYADMLARGEITQQQYEAWTPYGRSERRNIREIEPTSDADLRDLFDAMQEAQVVDEGAQFEARAASRGASGPPEAPWQGDKWEELLFREAVRDAVASGETRISWTTGAQQAERYNKLLANNVQRLEYDGQTLRVRDTGGGEHSYDVDTQDQLVDYVGTSLASKLMKGIEEQPEVRFDRFRVERPVEGGYGATHRLDIPVEDMREGDVAWIGYGSDDMRRRPHSFHVRERDGNRIFVTGEYLDPKMWEYADRFPDAPNGWGGAEFAQIAKGIQRDQARDWGERPRHDPVVLEGENITVGGGGFIDAYDRRMRSYAKKYLGVEPRLVPLDDLYYDTVYASTPEHPDYPRELVERVAAEPSRPRTAPRTEAQLELESALDSILPVHRVKAGDIVLAESESLQAALQAAYRGGADAGVWPERVRRVGDQWVTVYRGGTPGGSAPSWERAGQTFFDSAQEAVDAIERGHGAEWISDFDQRNVRAASAGDVWTVEIPEKFATQLHEKGSPLFQRRRGSVLGLTRLTDEGADIYLDRDAADMATWVEEAAHAVIPKWFDDADARFDPRADYVREKIGVGPGEQLTAAAHEEFVRLLQVWLLEGSAPAAQQRSLWMSLSREMKAGLEGAAGKVVRNAEERKKFDRLLTDPEVTSFIREAFDPAPYKELDPGPIFFQTMKTEGRIARPGTGKLQRAARSILPSRRSLTKHPNTMRAWESGNFDVGPDMTAHYANAELRSRMQDEQARRVLRYQEPIEIVNGVPVLKDGYQVYNYYGIRRANARVDEMFRRSQRYGDIDTAEEPMLSADPASGSIIDMEPEDFTDFADEVVGSILKEEALYDSIAEAEYVIGDRFVELIREGKVGQIPNDVAETFLNASGAGFSLASTNTALRLLMTALRVPSMLARWRMVGKFAYPITNTAFTGLLVGLNQLPSLPVNIYRSYWPGQLTRATRIRLLQEVGVGTAELVDVPELVGRNRIERWQAGEQATFRKFMHWMSTPEAHVRMWQVVNDLGDAGYRTEADIQRLFGLVDEGNEGATRLLNQVGRNSEDAVVRFRGMHPDEQIFVRDILFVYGWLRSAARFTVRFPLERPVTAAAMFHIGQYGWEKLQEDFYALPWEQQGAIPIGKRREGEETMVKLLDLSQLFPFKSGLELLRIPAQYLGLLETGLRPASFADLLSPSAETALRALYGQDPRFATGFWEGMKYDADPRNLPGVFWLSRLIDPSLTGTKLRSDRDRWNVLLNLFTGQVAPYEVKQSVEYERWLEQQPSDLRTLIREQNDAEAFARIGEAAYKVEGGALSMEQLRAINADSAYGIYTGLLQSKRRRDKKDSGYYLTSLERAASKAKMLQSYFPDAYEEAENEVRGLDPRGNAEDAETYIQVMEDTWEEYVSDVKSEVRTAVKDNLGYEMPESNKVPLNRWARDLRWLQTAPPESIERIRDAMERQHVTAENTLALAPIIEDEMRRMVKP